MGRGQRVLLDPGLAQLFELLPFVDSPILIRRTLHVKYNNLCDYIFYLPFKS